MDSTFEVKILTDESPWQCSNYVTGKPLAKSSCVVMTCGEKEAGGLEYKAKNTKSIEGFAAERASTR